MIGKLLNRSIRHRWKAVVVWAMAPLAMLNGRVVSGCMSPTGHFELNCQCAASVGSNVTQAGANHQAGARTCCCHCPCCQGGTCCCGKGKSSCCSSLAKNTRRTPGNGMEGSHCTQIAFYTMTPAVNVSLLLGDNHQSTDFASLAIDLPSTFSRTTREHVAELNTGPPPDNLVVELHRFLI